MLCVVAKRTNGGGSRGGGYEEDRFGDRRGFDARPDDRGRDRGGFRCFSHSRNKFAGSAEVDAVQSRWWC